MFNFQYKIKVFNHKGERINRNKTIFPAEETKAYTVRERAFKEIKACKDLEIREVVYICPVCSREYTKRHGLFTHINISHPGGKHLLYGKK